jgi:hypothetical protein
MSEPEYKFIKGHGWVPMYDEDAGVEQATVNYNGWRVTLYRRTPKLGERGWTYRKSNFQSELDDLAMIYAGGLEVGWECDARQFRVLNENPHAVERWGTIKAVDERRFFVYER